MRPPARCAAAGVAAVVRDRPFGSARPLATLAEHQPVTVLDEHGEFAQVQMADGRRGYVLRAALRTALLEGAEHPTVAPQRLGHGEADRPRAGVPGEPGHSDAWSRALPVGRRMQAAATAARRGWQRAAAGAHSVRWAAARYLPAGWGRNLLAGSVALPVALMLLMLVGRSDGGQSSATASAAADAPLTWAPSEQPAAAPAPALAAPSPALRFPQEGATVSSPVRVDVRVGGTALKLPAAGDPLARHLHYFLDTDPATVVGPGQPVPSGIPRIFHSDAASLTVDLSPGAHAVWVVLTDNDHVPLVPAAQAHVSFTVSAAARSAEEAPLVYQSLIDGHWRLVVRQGTEVDARVFPGGPWDDIDPAWSPDGSRLAFASNRDGRLHLYAMDADGGGLVQLTQGAFRDRTPAWSPDGRRLAFSSDRDGDGEQVFVVPAEGGAARRLTEGAGGGAQPAWSPDGGTIAFIRLVGGLSHIFTVSALGGAATQLTTAPQRHIDPAWSPDGQRIAYAALRENRWSLYVIDTDGSNPEQVTAEEADRRPAWSPTGRDLVFESGREGQQQIFSVELATGEVRRLSRGMAHSINPGWPRR